MNLLKAEDPPLKATLQSIPSSKLGLRTICKILASIVVLVLIIFPASPFRSWYGKHVLLGDPVLSQLQLQNYCKYEEPIVFGDSPHGPLFSCITPDRFNWNDQKTKIDSMRKMLESNSWILSTKETFNDRNVIYYKGKLRIEIQPYEWEHGYAGKEYKLLVEYQ